jgi:hypothetical protein
MNDRILSGRPPSSFPIVAIIDDGVSVAELSFRKSDQVIGGRSFTPIEEPKPWYFSESGHGTAVARIILSLSPGVRILVARTDTTFGGRETSIAEVGTRSLLLHSNK